nr:DUF4199 domain-containing protein [Hymenobacter sp. BT730]
MGVLSLLWLVFLYLGGDNPYGPKRLMSTVLLPFAAVLCQWYIRRYFMPTGPGLGRSVLTGLLTVIFASVISAGGLYGFARAADPELIEKNGNELRAILQAGKGTYLKQRDGAKRFQLEEAALRHTPQADELAMDEFYKKLILGVLFVLPGAIFFRK